MAPLKNPRHEAFIRHLLEGKDACDAYEFAGFKRDDGNAARLKANPKVAARLAELQAEIAAETTVTVQGLLNELEEARKKATDLKQLNAAIAAINAKAKLSGLMVERQKIEVGGPGAFDGCNSVESVVDELLRYHLNPYHDLKDDDRTALISLFNECFAEADKIIQTIVSRPPIRVVGFKRLPPPHSNGHDLDGQAEQSS